MRTPRAWGAWILALAGCMVLALAVAADREQTRPLSHSDEPISPIRPMADLDPKKVELGARLFRDPRLSGDGRVSCASCHDLASNGAGNSALDEAPDRPPSHFNTPTIFNAALNFRLSWQGAFRTLEAQAVASLENPRVMKADIPVVVDRLRTDASISRVFREAFGRELDRDALIEAIASYERSLTTPGSRFDRWLQGDAQALSAQELRGYRTFKSVGCVSCHQGANVGGNLFQRSGIFSPVAAQSVPRLRVPSLRNVATTAPYFHDGSAANLPTAITAMGRAQLGVTLGPEDTADIAAFLQTLTGQTGQHAGRPVKAAPP